MENKELPDNQRKGIEVVVKAAKKVYPFIIDWQLTDTWEKYETTLYIDLFLDVEKLAEQVDLKRAGYFFSRLERGEEVKSAALFAPFEWGDYGSEEFEKISQQSFDLATQISKTMNQAYDFLPDDLKRFWQTLSGKHECRIKVDYFIFRP